MKKQLLILIALLFLALLTSCSSPEQYPFVNAESEFMFGDILFYTNSEGLLASSTADGEEHLLCYDPLCTHSSLDCPAYHTDRSQLAVVMGEKGTPIVFYTAGNRDFDHDIRTYSIYRLDMASGERTAVLSDQPEIISDFSIYGNCIYFKMQCTQYNEDGHAIYIGNNLFSMELDGKNLRQLTEGTAEEDNVFDIVGITGEYDSPRIYWMESSVLGNSLYVSPADFSEKKKLLDGISFLGNFIRDGYLYYSAKTEETTEALIVPAHPEDKTASPDKSKTIRRGGNKIACYRLDLAKENSPPKLIYSGIAEPLSGRNTFFIHENQAYIIPYEPLFLESIAAAMNGQTGNLAEDLRGGSLQIDYIAANSGEKLLELDLESGDMRIIETPGYDPQSVIGIRNGVLFVNGMVTDCERIRENLAQNGVSSSSFSFAEERQIDIE